MRGKLHKTSRGWIVKHSRLNDDGQEIGFGKPEQHLIHPKYEKIYFLDDEAEGGDVEFEIVTEYIDNYTNQTQSYAKLIKPDLNKLESKLDKALSEETSESLNEWITKKRNPSITLKERVMGVLKAHSIEKVEDWSYIIEQRDFPELADNLIKCFEHFGSSK